MLRARGYITILQGNLYGVNYSKLMDHDDSLVLDITRMTNLFPMVNAIIHE